MQNGAIFMGETNSPIATPVESRRFSIGHIIAAVVATALLTAVVMHPSAPIAAPLNVAAPTAPKAAAAAAPEVAVAPKAAEAPVPVAKESSNECAEAGEKMCYGPMKGKNPYNVFRQCTKGLKASACACSVLKDGKVVESYPSNLIKGFLCKCSYKVNDFKAKSWGMQLFCTDA